jgi:heat shock 70kDa protein 4
VAKFDISGMPEVGTAGEIPRVRVYLRQDISGVLHAESAIYMEEKADEPEPAPAPEADKKDVAPADEGKKDGAAADEGKKGAESTEESGKSADVEEPPKKKKKRYKRVSLKVEATYSGTVARDVMIDQQSIEANLAGTDRLIRETSDARNDLETFVYEFRDKLDGNLSSFSTEEERESVKGRLASEEDWLYTDEADETSKSGFVGKLKDLKSLVEHITNRETEANGRGHACNELRKLTQFYLGIVNGNDEKYDHLTDEERDTVRKACGESDVWLSNLQDQQMALAASVDPVLKIKDISNKWSETDKVCKPIVSRKKPAPKVEERKEEVPAAKAEEAAAPEDAGKKTDGETASEPTEDAGSKEQTAAPEEDASMD